MDKQEKYINYIIGDLIKNTEVKNEEEHIVLPFITTYPSFSTFTPYVFLLLIKTPSHLFEEFITYVKGRYGASGDEVIEIWEIYVERIRQLIDNG